MRQTLYNQATDIATNDILTGVDISDTSMASTGTTKGYPFSVIDARYLTTASANVFNEAGADIDFRMEGDTNQNLFFLDASTDRIGIGTNSPSEILHISKTTGNFTTIRFDSGTTQGYFFAYDGDPSVNIGSNSNAPVNLKVNNTTIASLTSARFNVGDDHFLNLDGSVVFNETGADADFRIEGDTATNLFYVDASADSIGIGTPTPNAKLDVLGKILAQDFQLYKADPSFTMTNTNDGTSQHGFIQVTYGSMQFGYSNTTGVDTDAMLYIGKAFVGGGKTIIATVHTNAISGTGDLGNTLDDGTGGAKFRGALGLTDGMTAPSTIAGFAQLYVDTADGDLKVKFGDGTVKTIVVDT